MPNFFDWCKARKLDPFSEPEVKSEGSSALRGAVRAYAYPPAYGRAQYPPEYFRPFTPDAPVYQELDGIKPQKETKNTVKGFE